jgi:flotillin
MDIEEINADRDKFLAAVSQNVEAELRKIGLKLINVNVTDIRDESGYIEALGKEAAAKAINDAKKSVAEQNRYGETGKANADKDTRINVAAANADAASGWKALVLGNGFRAAGILGSVGKTVLHACNDDGRLSGKGKRLA